MDEFIFLLNKELLPLYIEMVPDTLIERWQDNTDMEIWGVNEESDVAGVMVTQKNGKETILRYIYIKELFRGRGLALIAITKLKYESYLSGSRYLTVKYVPDEYPAVRNLLWGTVTETIVNDAGSFRLRLSDFTSKRVFSKRPKSSVSLYDCGARAKLEFGKKMSDEGWDIVNVPLDDEEYDPSSAVILSGDDAKAMLLVKHPTESKLEVPLMVSFDGGPDAVIDMIRFSTRNAAEMYPENIGCEFHVITAEVLNFLEKALGRSAHRSVTCRIDLTYFDDIVRNIEETYERL